MLSNDEVNKQVTVTSSFGRNLKVTIWGGSHEPHIGVTIKGLPENIPLDFDRLKKFLARRAPGNSIFTTPRKEADIPVVKEGLVNGKTTSDPLTVIIENTNTRSKDYAAFRDIPRPGHADFTASVKYGNSVNMAGGGPFSARLTAPLCIAGGIALQILEKMGIQSGAHLFSVGSVRDTPFDPLASDTASLDAVKSKAFPVIDDTQGELMKEAIRNAMADGDSLGGIVEGWLLGLPAGIGGPMYDGIEGHLAHIFFGIPAVKGVEFGMGFKSAALKGSENNDDFSMQDGAVKTITNNHGGILGGISSGMPLYYRLAFKPTPSISKEQNSISLSEKTNKKLSVAGRHDPCVAIRAVPVAEAAAAVGILDLLLERKEYLL